MPEGAIAAILLAAGESTRMGRLKQLLPWGESTLLAWQAAELLAAGCDDVVMVLGHKAATIEAEAGALAGRVVVNAGYLEGRASSLRVGAEAVAGGTGAIVVLSVDQPRPGWLSRRLIEAWRQTRAPLVVPTFDGRWGHPLLVDGALLGELRAVTEAELGLRAVTVRHRAEARETAIENAAINVDLNTPADYEHAYVAWQRGEWRESHAT